MNDRPPVSEKFETRGRVLVADDDELVRNGLSAQLNKAGFDCAGAPSAEAALPLLENGGFEAVIADIHMPGNVELEFVEKVAAVSPGLPIILLTGRPTVETAARSVRLPVYAYLVKPPQKEEIQGLLDQAVAQHRRRRAVHESRERLHQYDRELEVLEGALAGESSLDSASQMSSFLRLTLRQMIGSLLDLERASMLLEKNEQSGAFFEKAELITALRYTVDVLEKTKQNFKSKEIGQLRNQLEWLLRQQQPKRES